MGLLNETDRLRGRKGKPAAAVRVTSFPRGHHVKNRIEHITRAKEKSNIEFETESGHVGRGPGDIKKLYEDWRQDFERKKPGAKREPRHATYIVLHTKAPNDPTNAYKVNTAARDFLQKRVWRAWLRVRFCNPSRQTAPARACRGEKLQSPAQHQAAAGQT